MSFELSKIDWDAISAISTFLAVLVALFYQPFLNRRKVVLDTNLRTENGNIHLIYLCITNKGEKPIWIVSGGLLFEDGEKKVVKFMDGDTLPKKLEPSEFIICPTPIMEYNYKIKDLFAKDSLGKFWYLKRKQRKELDKNIRICKDHNPPLVRSKPAEYVERPKPKSKS